MSQTLSFTLESPVVHAGQTYDVLTFRRWKTIDLIATDVVKGEMRKSAAMFASMAGVPIQVIEQMDGDDFMRLAPEVAPLMGKAGAALAAVPAAGAEAEASH